MKFLKLDKDEKLTVMIINKYTGEKIPKLYFTSRMLEKNKVILTAYGFLDERKNLIWGTEKTAALLWSRCKLQNPATELHFGHLNSRQIRDIFRGVIRQNKTYLLYDKCYPEKKELILFPQNIPPLTYSYLHRRSREFCEKSSFTQFLEACFWGCVPGTILLIKYYLSGTEDPDHNNILIKWFGIGLFLSGIWSTIKILYYGSQLKDNILTGTARALSNCYQFAQAAEIFAANPYFCGHSLINPLLKQAEHIKREFNRIQLNGISLPEEEKEIWWIKNWINGEISKCRLKNGGSSFLSSMQLIYNDTYELLEINKMIIERSKNENIPQSVLNSFKSALSKNFDSYTNSTRYLSINLEILFKD